MDTGLQTHPTDKLVNTTPLKIQEIMGQSYGVPDDLDEGDMMATALAELEDEIVQEELMGSAPDVPPYPTAKLVNTTPLTDSQIENNCISKKNNRKRCNKTVGCRYDEENGDCLPLIVQGYTPEEAWYRDYTVSSILNPSILNPRSIDCGPGTGDQTTCNSIRGCKYTEDGECLPKGYEYSQQPISKKEMKKIKSLRKPWGESYMPLIKKHIKKTKKYKSRVSNKIIKNIMKGFNTSSQKSIGELYNILIYYLGDFYECPLNLNHYVKLTDKQKKKEKLMEFFGNDSFFSNNKDLFLSVIDDISYENIPSINGVKTTKMEEIFNNIKDFIKDHFRGFLALFKKYLEDYKDDDEGFIVLFRICEILYDRIKIRLLEEIRKEKERQRRKKIQNIIRAVDASEKIRGPAIKAELVATAPTEEELKLHNRGGGKRRKRRSTKKRKNTKKKSSKKKKTKRRRRTKR